jgi:neutral trehalase
LSSNSEAKLAHVGGLGAATLKTATSWTWSNVWAHIAVNLDQVGECRAAALADGRAR